MASVLIVLKENLLSNFCRVYSNQIPSVQYTFADLPVRKMIATIGSIAISYWIVETRQDSVEFTLLTKLLDAYTNFFDDNDANEVLYRIVLIGFPPSLFELPDWLVQPASARELETSIGLRIGITDRASIMNLFSTINQNQSRSNTDFEYIRPNIFQRRDHFGTLIITGGAVSLTSMPRSNVMVDLTGNNNNNNNSNLAFIQDPGEYIATFGLPSTQDFTETRELFPVKQKRKRDTKEETEKKRGKLLSRLKLAEEKHTKTESPEKQTNRCCCCFEDFIDPYKEYDQSSEQYGDDIFVVPVALVPCQHRLCIDCARSVRDKLTNECPLCKRVIEGWETYHCVSCLKNQEIPKGPNIVIVRPCEHRVWCKECAEESIKKDDLKCPLCDFPVDDIRVAKEYK